MRPDSVLITDTHFDKDNLEEVLDVMFQCVDYAVEIGVKKIRHLGDGFTDRTGQGLLVLLAMTRWAEYAESKGMLIEMIPGNHDKTNLESENSYFDVYSKHENITVIRKETIIVDKRGIAHCYLPYFKENGSYPIRLTKLLKRLKKTSYTDAYLYTHIAVDKVKNNDGSKVSNGLKIKMFKIFKKVFVGHYHDKSKLGKNIYYIGSGRPKDFGEDDEKGFTVLYQNGDHELIRARFNAFKKVKIDLDDISPEEIEALRIRLSKLTSNRRVIFNGTQEQIEALDLRKFKEAGIDIKRETKNVTKSIEAASRGEVVEYDTKEIKKRFLRFCSRNEVEKEKRIFGMKNLFDVHT